VIKLDVFLNLSFVTFVGTKNLFKIHIKHNDQTDHMIKVILHKHVVYNSRNILSMAET
jgi:hypothetical protein